jgi:hypothetical protein
MTAATVKKRRRPGKDRHAGMVRGPRTIILQTVVEGTADYNLTTWDCGESCSTSRRLLDGCRNLPEEGGLHGFGSTSSKPTVR